MLIDNRKPVCYVFTNFSPYGDNEVFLKAELPFLALGFKKVLVFSFFEHKGERNILPENVTEVVIKCEETSNSSSLKIILKNIFLWLRILGSELYINGFASITDIRVKNAELINQFRNASLLMEWIALNKKSNEETVYYSYWFDRWTTILGILKAKGFIKKFITRAHAFDLYEDYLPEKHIPFRKFQLQSVERVFTVSMDGKQYLQSKYPEYGNKFNVALLGTKSIEYRNRDQETQVFTIVSCGSVQSRKRTIEMPVILKELSFKYKWVHFGDGPDFDKLKVRIEELGITEHVELKGFRKNSEFLNYLTEYSPNVFISLSENEGVPYSIMEAISVGIPVIATDAGGCREICTSETGVLLPLQINHSLIASTIENFKNSDKNTASFKLQVKEFWRKKFNAESNFSQFIEILYQYTE